MPENDQNTSHHFGIKLNMQMIADHLQKIIPGCLLERGNDTVRLLSARFYKEGEATHPAHVYIGKCSLLKNMDTEKNPDCALISVGLLPDSFQKGTRSVITLPEDTDIAQVFNEVQAVFERYHSWDSEMQSTLNNDGGVDQLCQVAVHFFNNPMFIHDSEFYILSCPIKPEGMTSFETEEKTGREIIPLQLINEFKVDAEYLRSLAFRHAAMSVSTLYGYRILIVNLWIGDQYAGRICINEIFSPIESGQLLAAEYFASVIQVAMRRRNLQSGSYLRSFDEFLKDVMDKKVTDETQIATRIGKHGWKMNDHYFCILLGIENRHFETLSAASTCNDIERKVPGSYAFIYRNNILVLVNLSASDSTRNDSLSQLPYILREGLFKAGASNIFSTFSEAPDHYIQAQIALEIGTKSNSMSWYYRFEEYALKYICESAGKNIPVSILCSESLQKLKEYDEQNQTEMYPTLITYLQNDRNATGTARKLFIHRSSLLYRLERIREIMDVDFEHFEVRMYLLLSYMMLREWDKERFGLKEE